MAITKIPLTFRLQIRWNTGLDAQMDPVYATRSWSNVKPDATAEQLHQLGVHLNTLCVHVADSIRVQELYALDN